MCVFGLCFLVLGFSCLVADSSVTACRCRQSSHAPAMISGITRPVFLIQNHRKESSPLSQPQLNPKKLFVSLAVPEIDHSSSGTATTHTPAPKISHSFHLAGRIAKQKPVTINSAARLCRWTSGS